MYDNMVQDHRMSALADVRESCEDDGPKKQQGGEVCLVVELQKCDRL